ncbi:MAG: GAF domain-containing protein [Candidatus Scalindua sp.]|nr:GAF domain-containing protein [Candidatus Scalindua sp.]
MITIKNSCWSSKSNDKDSLCADVLKVNQSFLSSKEVQRIGIVLTSVFDLKRLYQLIIEMTTESLRVRNASIMILEGDVLRIRESKHLTKDIMEHSRQKVGEGISGSVALKGKYLLIEDIEEDMRFGKKNSNRYMCKSLLSMPLVYNKEVVGVINVSDKYDKKPFRDNDVEILQVISKYSTLAIRNILLIERSKKRSIIEELDKFYHNCSNKFLPVTLQSLKSGPFKTSELYLENKNNGMKSYILYWKGGKNLFVNEKREEFIRRNVNKLFVPKEGKRQYLRFIETNMGKIVEDNSIRPIEKFKVINDIAINIINDSSTASDGICDIERSKHLVGVVTDFILNNRESIFDLIKVLKHDNHSETYPINVTVLGLSYANYIGISYEELLEFGLGLFLQDIGMRRLAPSIINKPGELSEEEFANVKKHPEIGYQILQDTGNVPMESCILAMLHHENFDGSGYPYGLEGNDIEYSSRISRVVDVYNALISHKPYGNSISSEKAYSVMKEEMEGVFDREVLDGFFEFLWSANSKLGKDAYGSLSNREILQPAYKTV